MPRLSACLIVKDEERHLARCLASVRALADEIVVVDTGSRDRTVDIARAHGARVCGFAWRDDFSLAKNYSIEQATGDWILSIDADESIAIRDHDRIRAAVRQHAVDAVIVPQRHYLAAGVTPVGWQPGPGGYEEGEPYPGFVDVDCRRLFRNQPWLRFRNRVHEELASIVPGRQLAEARGDWVIHHYGKLDDHGILRAKGEAYLRIGLTKVEQEPRNPQAHYELGVQYAELDQPEAALASFERALALSSGFRDAQFRIALCRLKLGEYQNALAALRLSARALPQHAVEIAFAEGNVHRALGDDRAAERAFRRALGQCPAFAPASLNLALLYNRQNRPADALACLDEALRHSPRRRDLQLRRARVLTTLRRFADARDALASLDESGADAEVSALRGAAALGLGDLEAAISELRRSLERQPTEEAAVNLSAALEACGDRTGALAAAAGAIRLAPGSQALDRFARLSGDELRRREGRPGAALTFFFYQPHSLPYDGSTPRTRGLGGTESAVVYLAEALVRRGHRCLVFNGCESPGTVEGVEYARWEAMPERCLADRPDVVVGVRFWHTIGRARLAPLQIFWTGDAFDQPFVETISDPQRRPEIDLFMLQSAWQAETFQMHHHVSRAEIVRTTLGTAASAALPPIRPGEAPRPRRLAYASTPFRGLDVLLGLFPRIRAACPDAELEIFSSMQVYGVTADEDRAQFEALYRRAEQPGVTLVGSVPQVTLAARLQQARILAYPNHYPETFCVAAAEAQAAGCVIVTSQLGALPETVGAAGICIPGEPRSPAYQQAFVDACVRLLTDERQWQTMHARALERAWADFSWPVIAEHWETLCRGALVAEPPQLERIVLHVAAGRAALAHRMLARAERPADVPADAWEALQAFVAWRAGEGEAPSTDRMRRVALCFRSLRRTGLLEPALDVASLCD